MSRLLVKNLPAYLTQSRLREHFESKDGPGGTLTDVKVVLKPDGTSRRFGFVGYKTDAEASKAQKWFDRTFVHSSKISVTIVDGTKDVPAPRPNKRPRLDGPSTSDKSSNVSSSSKGKEKATVVPSSSKSGQLEEYMKVMQPRSKGPSWANEDAVPGPSVPAPAPVSKAQPESNLDDDMTVDPQPEDESKTDVASDLDWLQRHTKSALTLQAEDKVFEQSDTESGDLPEPQDTDNHEPPPSDPNKASILETSRLFLRNLAFSCTEAELSELVAPFGTVSQVHIPLDPTTKSPKGMAYVTFAKPEDAVSAYEALDRKSFQGRLLHILPAVNRKGKVEVEDVGKRRSLKGDREVQRKATAGKEFNWSMLYMNSDAVVSSIADRMNMSKADILNPESDNAAVKLALAETHIIQETKSFLEANGVNLAALSSETRVPRSDTTLLVKNIPYGTTVEQIRELFEPHGQLQRVLVPPAGTMALVEFTLAEEGRKAFRGVAYRRLGNSIIYLEKGPVGMFVSSAETAQPVTATAVKPVTIAEQDAAAQTEEPTLASGTTLFVKNLSFSTTSERLTQVFRNLPSFAFARVQTKLDPKHAGGRLSMGYGFVGFKDADGARKALKSMSGYALDGHALVVKFAGRGTEEDQETEGKAKSTTTKMLVKNVPFEATKKDIRELFGSHGQLKSVRLPKRFDHRSRGFAFLEFLTRHEAENAYAALKHTHLLGRHLVLQWADEAEQDIEELRKKAGVGFGDGKELPGRKRKLQLGDNEDDVEEM